MSQVRLGAVGYLNARPLVYGLEGAPRFTVRYDIPSRCAALLHDETIDVGLIPSIEYLRGGPYRVVPGLAIASRGAVRSVALYTKKPIGDVRSIAMDTSSRTSVALVGVLCARLFRIQPLIDARGPDLSDMLEHCDAALLIGDNALFLDERAGIEKIDLGEAWLTLTGLPFVYAFWAGRPNALAAADVAALQHARDEGVKRPADLARAYLAESPERQALGARYLRDIIKYDLGDDERAGLETFYRYAAEIGIVDKALMPTFYDER
ncbi:MAG TPA: menaquinone biosynthesis protein [Vicinamibacterales bacterium]